MAATALTTFTQTINENETWSGSTSISGLAAGPTGQGNIVNSFVLAKSSNTSVGGADVKLFQLLTITASSSSTINLQSFTDIANASTTNLMYRVKYVRIWLLSTSQTAPDGTAGTACTGIAVGNAGSNPFSFGLSSTTTTFTINNGSQYEYRDGSATGIAVSSAAKNILVTNSDSANSAIVLVEVTGGTT